MYNTMTPGPRKHGFLVLFPALSPSSSSYSHGGNLTFAAFSQVAKLPGCQDTRMPGCQDTVVVRRAPFPRLGVGSCLRPICSGPVASLPIEFHFHSQGPGFVACHSFRVDGKAGHSPSTSRSKTSPPSAAACAASLMRFHAPPAKQPLPRPSHSKRSAKYASTNMYLPPTCEYPKPWLTNI